MVSFFLLISVLYFVVALTKIVYLEIYIFYAGNSVEGEGAGGE